MDVLAKSTKHRQSTQINVCCFFCKNKKLPGIENRNEKENFKLGTSVTRKQDSGKEHLLEEPRKMNCGAKGEKLNPLIVGCLARRLDFSAKLQATNDMHAFSKACLFVHRLPDWLGGIKIPCTTCTQNHSHRDASTKYQ